MTTDMPADTRRSIFLRFLRFGLLAWGGPVAQIGMIRDELVGRLGWVTPEKFNRVLAVYQALPGPEAHELCVYFGMVRGGRWGGFLAGLGFMLPGFVLVLLLAAAYQAFGAASLLPLFAGVAPAVTALILRALHRIAAHGLHDAALAAAALVALALTLAGVHFIAVFIICAAFRALWAAGRRIGAGLVLCAGVVLGAAFFTMPAVVTAEGGGSLLVTGLQAGLLSFGGAYTALPFLREGMVGVYDGVTAQGFIDAIALSSIVPAPLVIVGTFLGYLAAGLAGAVLVTLGIFAPAFGFTLLGHKYLERLIDNRALHGVLDGIAAAVVGLLALTAAEIAWMTLQTPWAWALFVPALVALYAVRHLAVIPLVIIACGLAGWFLPL